MLTSIKSTAALLAITSLLFAGSAMAQPQNVDRDWQKGPPSVEEKLARLSNALDLSDEQSAEMLAVLQEQQKDRIALHEQTMAIMGAEICAQRARTEEAILSILDAEQAALFTQLKEERQTRGGDRTRSRKAHGEPDCSAYGDGE